MKSQPKPKEGSAREERMESHAQEMAEQAKMQGDMDMQHLSQVPYPKPTNPGSSKGNSKG